MLSVRKYKVLLDVMANDRDSSWKKAIAIVMQMIIIIKLIVV